MMEYHEFCDDCPGCRPAMLNLETQRRMPDDHPVMIAINRVWDEDTTYSQRRAFIEVTLHNSRNAQDVRLTKEVAKMFEEALPD